MRLVATASPLAGAAVGEWSPVRDSIRTMSKPVPPDGGRLGNFEAHAFFRAQQGVDGIAGPADRKMAAREPAQAMMRDPERFCDPQPWGNHGSGFRLFTDGVGLQVHIFAGVGEAGRECVQRGHRNFAGHQCADPVEVPQVAPSGVEQDPAVVDDAAAQKQRTGQDREPEPDVAGMRDHRMSVTDVVPRAVDDDRSGEQYVHLRIAFEEILDDLEAAGEVLFVTVEVGEDIALGATIAAIDGVVHAFVLFHEGLDAFVVRQPVQGSVIRAGVLDDVFEGDPLLIGHRRNAQFEPLGIPKARGDNRELHGGSRLPTRVKLLFSNLEKSSICHHSL
jgi:hypothetical protein